MHTLRHYLRATVIWLMVPVTLFAGTPRVGCVCANGEHKVICERHLSSCCRNAEQGSGEKGPCSCCHKGHAAQEKRNQASSGCCKSPDGCPNGQTTSEPCCKPVTIKPLLPPVAQHVDLLDVGFVALFFPSVELLQVTVSPTRETVWNPALPVPDLVIAHQVFLI